MARRVGRSVGLREIGTPWGDLNDFYNWKDRGCHLHPKCLECPRPICVFEEKAVRANADTTKRDARLLELLHTMPMTEAAKMMGVHRATAYYWYRQIKQRGDR